MARLQRRDRVADGGLRKIQRSRRLRHMLALGDGHKNTELIERHLGLVPIVSASGSLGICPDRRGHNVSNDAERAI